jgi:hypothetical protein
MSKRVLIPVMIEGTVVVYCNDNVSDVDAIAAAVEQVEYTGVMACGNKMLNVNITHGRPRCEQ